MNSCSRPPALAQPPPELGQPFSIGLLTPASVRTRSIARFRAQIWCNAATQGSTIRSSRWSADGGLIASAAADGARVWTADGDPVTGSLARGGEVIDIDFSPDAKRVVTGSADRKVEVWSVAAASKPLSSFALADDDAVQRVRFDPRGERVAIATKSGQLTIWAFERAAHVAAASRHADAILDLAWSPSGDAVATAGSDRTVRVWNASLGELLLPTLMHDEAVQSVAYSPDGERILSTSADGVMRLWAADTGVPLTAQMKGASQIERADFSPDGLLIRARSSQTALQLWDARTGAALSPPLAPASGGGELHDAQMVAPDLSRVAFASDYGLLIWQPPWARKESPQRRSLLCDPFALVDGFLIGQVIAADCSHP